MIRALFEIRRLFRRLSYYYRLFDTCTFNNLDFLFSLNAELSLRKNKNR